MLVGWASESGVVAKRRRATRDERMMIWCAVLSLRRSLGGGKDSGSFCCGERGGGRGRERERPLAIRCRAPRLREGRRRRGAGNGP